MKSSSDVYCLEDTSPIKEIGRYTAATVEYSALVLLSVIGRGGRTVKSVTGTVYSPFEKLRKGFDSAAAPLKRLGKNARKLATPFTWTARQVVEVGGRGVPVHLDRKSIEALQGSLLRIEKRLASIESNGLSVAAYHPTPNDFREKPNKEKNMLLRAVLEDSKQTLDQSKK